MNNIEKEFKTYLNDSFNHIILTEPADRSRPFWLRPSSLPFCGLRRLLQFAEKGIPKFQDVRSETEFYTRVGSVSHLVFQKILGRGGKIIGDWYCPKCKVKRVLKTYRRCPKCNRPMKHREVEVGHKVWRGHIDNIFVAESGEWWLVDYKTCRADFVKNDRPLPQSYVEQLNHYVPLLEKKTGQSVAGWMLVFLARENPFSLQKIVARKMSESRKKKVSKQAALYGRLHKHLLKVEDGEGVPLLYEHKRCANKSEHDQLFPYESCPYADVCFSEKKMMQKAVKIIEKSEHLPLIDKAPTRIREELLR